MTATLDQKLYNLAVSAVEDVEHYCGHSMSPEKFLEIMKQDNFQPYFIEEVNNSDSYDEPSAYSLDTCVRDEALEMIALHATGRSWPTYGASEKVRDKFWASMKVFFNEAKA